MRPDDVPKPDNLPGNVIPLRPRAAGKMPQPAAQSSTSSPKTSQMESSAQAVEPLQTAIGQVIDLSAVAAQHGTSFRHTVAQSVTETINAGDPLMKPDNSPPKSTAAAPPPADGIAKTKIPAAANGQGSNTAPVTTGGGTGPSRRFSWRGLLIILGVAFLLGAGIAWGAIAIGAEIVDFWPHGFAFYAMLVGGGITMMLTAGLMTAVFYSDSSGHDDEVHQFQPDKPRRTSLRP